MIFPVTFIEDTHTPQFETVIKLLAERARAEIDAMAESANREIGQLTRTDSQERDEFGRFT